MPIYCQWGEILRYRLQRSLAGSLSIGYDDNGDDGDGDGNGDGDGDDEGDGNGDSGGDNDEPILSMALDAGRCPAITHEDRLCSTPHTCRVGEVGNQ